MAFRISRNAEGNCINFEGSSNPTYWNACLSGEVDSISPNLINIINDVRSNNVDGDTIYEFYNIPYTEFLDADGNGFSSAQEAADYITAQGNVKGLNDVGKDLTGVTLDFRLDQTNTSIILDNGESFGVNTIKAVNEGGVISIKSVGEGVPSGSEEAGDRVYFENLDHTLVLINESSVTGGINDVVNKLNELFTVGPFASVVIADPYSTMVANVSGVPAGYTLVGSTVVDPVGDDLATNTTSGSRAGVLSTATINRAGEYFTFDIRGEGQIGFGLVHTDVSYSGGYYSGNTNYADPSSFAVTNSAHYGFQFSHWFHPTPNGSWTNYGANTAYTMGPAWYNSNTDFEARDEWLAGDPIKIKVGLDENGYIAIYSLADDDVTWKLHARTTYTPPQTSEFRLGIKFANSSPRLYSAPKVHLLDTSEAPTSLGTQDITVFGEGITGTLASGITSTATDNLDNDGFVTTQVIDEVGEYFEFTWSAGGDANFGLFSENDHDVSDLVADTGSWSNNDYIFYGARAESAGSIRFSYSDQGRGSTVVSSVPAGSYRGRVGFDGQGRATIWYSDDGGTTWTVNKHDNASAPVGEYKFIWVAQEDGAVLDTLEQGVIDTAPTMNFRYIESPDGEYQYPLFATTGEASYYDTEYGGSGTYHTHVYPDDPTFASWYMPDNGDTHGGSGIPTSAITFKGNPITWTEITSLTNADLAPSTFSGLDQTFNENSAVNLQITPQDVSYTTTVAGLPDGLTFDGSHNINGTTGYVPETTTYTITVTRTNSYGSSQGSFDLTIQDNESIGTLTHFTNVYGNFVQPSRTILTHDALAEYDTVLSQDQELRFSYTQIPPTIGILNSGGAADAAAFSSESGDILGQGNYNFAETSKWDLRFVTFGGYVGSSSTKHQLVGWDDNTTITGSEGTNTGSQFRLAYEVDGSGSDYHMVLYRDGSELLTSAVYYSGDQTLHIAAFDDQQQSNVYIPPSFSVVNIGAGSTTPPVGFNDPLETGTMASLTLLGDEDDSVAQLTQGLKVNHRYIVPGTWLEANALPHIGESGKFFFGVPKDSTNWTSLEQNDFWAFFRLEAGSNSHTSWIKTAGSSPDDHQVNVSSLTDSFYDYAIEWDGTDLHVIGCNLNDLNSEPSIDDGGSFARSVTYSGFATDQSKTNQTLDLVMGVDLGAQVELSTSSLQQIRIPFGPRDILCGEASGGGGRYEIQPAASSFDDPGQHAPSSYSWDGFTIDAGYTYRFIYHPSMEAGDYIEFRLASDNTTVYSSGITAFDNTSDGDPKATEGYKGLTFAVPSDAPPLRLYHYNSYQSGSFDSGREIAIAGSTYTASVSGVTQEGPVANQTGTNLFDSGDHGWISIDEQLGAGERLVMNTTFLADLVDAMPDNSQIKIGLKDTGWAATTADTNFEGALRFVIDRNSSTDVDFRTWSGASATTLITTTVAGITSNNIAASLELTNSGNNIRFCIRSDSTNSADSVTATAYANWSSSYKVQTGDQGFGLTSIDIMVLGEAIAGNTTGMDTADVDWSGLSEISIPSPPVTNLTNWNKALDFSGSNEYLSQSNNSMYGQALQMNGLARTVDMGTRSQGETSDNSLSRPWATVVVFKSDGYSGNQMIWNQGEGSASGNDNIFLKVTTTGDVVFGWGREGVGYNQCQILTNISSSTWYGIYVAHSGKRLGGNNASAANLADCFDIRIMSSDDGFTSLSSNLSVTANWVVTGFRMDRTFAGDFTVGGRGTGYSFRGKVASMIVTTLIGVGNYTPQQQPGGLMPNDAQIEKMITDPVYWVNEYKVRQGLYNQSGPFRPPASQYTLMPFLTGSSTQGYRATQVWLMGDGTNDSYSNMIRNQVHPTDQNYTKLNMINMVSNDIETVNIAGLT